MSKDLKNCRIDDNGNITMKMVKMGMDIDETRNHRIRGIVPTDDGKFIFVEILEGNRPKINYTNMTKKEYEQRYPHDEYIWIDGCFRVDVPEDKFRNYSPEFRKYSTSYRNLEHNKENIITVLKQFNKNITDLELVDYNYMDEFNEEHGFFRLYDERLEHKREPLRIVIMNGTSFIQLKEKYSCYNYDRSVYYEEERDGVYKNFKMNELYKIFDKEKLDKTIEEYNKELDDLRNKIRKKDEEITL